MASQLSHGLEAKLLQLGDGSVPTSVPTDEEVLLGPDRQRERERENTARQNTKVCFEELEFSQMEREALWKRFERARQVEPKWKSEWEQAGGSKSLKRGMLARWAEETAKRKTKRTRTEVERKSSTEEWLPLASIITKYGRMEAKQRIQDGSVQSRRDSRGYWEFLAIRRIKTLEEEQKEETETAGSSSHEQFPLSLLDEAPASGRRPMLALKDKDKAPLQDLLALKNEGDSDEEQWVFEQEKKKPVKKTVCALKVKKLARCDKDDGEEETRGKRKKPARPQNDDDDEDAVKDEDVSEAKPRAKAKAKQQARPRKQGAAEVTRARPKAKAAAKEAEKARGKAKGKGKAKASPAERHAKDAKLDASKFEDECLMLQTELQELDTKTSQSEQDEERITEILKEVRAVLKSRKPEAVQCLRPRFEKEVSKMQSRLRDPLEDDPDEADAAGEKAEDSGEERTPTELADTPNEKGNEEGLADDDDE
jgi:hypothetical protein